jgi:transcription elongation factor GreA
MPDPIYLTVEGEAKLRAELADLKGPQRDEISRRLRDAIQMGDLSENADYHKAKEDQGFLEVGATVTVQEEDFEPETYYMVGAKEADPRNGKISNESPIGHALMGAHVGETVEAQTPNGVLRLKVLKIE